MEEGAGGELLNKRRQRGAGAAFADDDGAAHLLNPARKNLAGRCAHPIDQDGDRPRVAVLLREEGELQFAATHLHHAERPLIVADPAGDGRGDAADPARVPAQVEDHPVGVAEAVDGRLEFFDYRRGEDVEPDVADVTRAVGYPLSFELGVLRRKIAEPRRQLSFQSLSRQSCFAHMVFVVEVNDLHLRPDRRPSRP